MNIRNALPFASTHVPGDRRARHVGQGSQQILGGHLLAILRREQRELRARSAVVTHPLVRPEQVPQSLLLKSVTEDAPRRLPLLSSERPVRDVAAVGRTELLPVSEPLRRLALVG